MRLRWGLTAELVLGGCGESETQPGSKPDPATDRRSAACTEYREAVSAEPPPAAPDAYPAYMGDRLQLAERFIATVRDQPEGEPRARLLAAGSEILSQLSAMQETTEANFAGVMYTRLTTLEDAERRLDAAAEKAGVDCGAPDGPTEFATGAGEVCDAVGRVDGLPSRDAGLIREADARYIALAGRTSAGWSRQLVEACADLPLYEE